jgi:UDP-glucose 4-epimerase
MQKTPSPKPFKISLMNLEKAFKGCPVVVTGGLGFIGSNLVHRLVKLGANVLVVDSLIPGYGGNLYNIHDIKDQVKVNISDIRDIHAMRYLVQNQKYLFNLAGQVSHIDSMTDPFTDLEINVRGQLSIVEACRENNPGIRIVHAATRQQYGRPQYLPVDEKHVVHPTDVNGINKAAGEMYFMVYTQMYGLRSTSLRLTNTYGPRQLLAHDRQGFIAWFMRKALLGEEINIFGTGEQLRDMLYVDDVIEAFLLAAVNDNAINQIYNVGNSKPVSLKTIAETLIKIVGQGTYQLVPFPEDRKIIDIGDFYTDFSKIQREIGWQPIIELHDGLEQTLAYYTKHKSHYLVEPLEQRAKNSS